MASPSAVKLLQGYIWHPQDEEIDLGDYLPKTLEPRIHLIWDAITPPFTFFDDGTLAASQTFYQLTVIQLEVGPDDDPGALLPWLEALLAEMLAKTPESVGWQIMGDLRSVVPLTDQES